MGVSETIASTRLTAPVVETGEGAVIGEVTAAGSFAYRGIPYGASTGGANRFRPPQPVRRWDGVLEAFGYGPTCPQVHVQVAIGKVDFGTEDEDCLHLNVWTASLQAGRPVLVLFHGGAFRSGNQHILNAEGSRLSAEDEVVVVSMNHRIGILGHLYLGDEFGAECTDSGNVGMLDLAAALRWVRRNIEKFGGDPGNVTLFGLSGGGAKIVHAMAMPAFEGLFHRALVMDGHDLGKRNTLAAARRASRTVLDELGVAEGDLASLRALPAEKLNEALDVVSQTYDHDSEWGEEPWIQYDILSPVIDGNTLPKFPLDAIADGASSNIDLMILFQRWTHWKPFARPGTSRYGWLGNDDVVAVLRPLLGEQASAVVTGYARALPYASASTLLMSIVTDRDWWLPHLSLAEVKARGGGSPAYVAFNHTPSSAYELIFQIGNCGISGSPGGALSEQLISAVTAFARTGDPNTDGLPLWDPYLPGSSRILMLDYLPTVVERPFAQQLGVWPASSPHRPPM